MALSDELLPAYTPGWNPPPFPKLTLAAETALLLRVLWKLGYSDGRAGHITVLQPDGTLLINPRELSWHEVCASDMVTINAEGAKLAGKYSPSVAYGIHLEVRRRRPELGIVLHNHPHWSVVWGDCLRIPPIYDQTSASVPHPLELVDEYEGAVTGADDAAAVAEAFGSAQWALLANHGVLITAPSIGHAYMRAYTLEVRCKRAWDVEVLGGGRALPDDVALAYGQNFEPMSRSWWRTEARMELGRDPSVLD
jgi:L-fuculose-phosphate aldolase